MWKGGGRVCFCVCACVCVCVCIYVCVSVCVCVVCFIFSAMRLRLICVLFIIFQIFLGSLTTSGIMLFVTLFNGFRPWTNVGKISVLDVVGILE